MAQAVPECPVCLEECPLLLLDCVRPKRMGPDGWTGGVHALCAMCYDALPSKTCPLCRTAGVGVQSPQECGGW